MRYKAQSGELERRILDAVGEGVWTVNAEGLIDYVNACGAAILGYTVAEILNRAPSSFAFPGAVECPNSESHSQTAGRRGEFRMRHKNGSERWLQITSSPIVGPDGDCLGTADVLVDITANRILANELEQTAKELRDLYEAAPCGYHSLDANGVFIRINGTELRWLGYSRDEVVGKMCFADLLSQRYQERFEQNFALLKGGGGIRDTEYELRRKDETTFPVLLSTIALLNARGEFLMTQGSVFDLSERKRAQSELEESELRNTAILRAALDCIISVDGSGRVVEFNPAAESTFGYSREEALGKHVSAMVTSSFLGHAGRREPDDRGSIPPLSTFGKREHITARRRDGSEFPAELAVTPVPVHRQTIFTAYVRDITKEKLAERELHRYAEDLRAVSRRLVEVQEAERHALAGELHDLVGQKLTALSINLNIVKSQLTPGRAARIDARLEDSLKLVEETIESIRDVMAELRPAVLDDYGLTPALRWYAEQFAKRTSVATSVIERGPTRRLAPLVEEALYRIAQEALANVAKYARARQAEVILATTPQSICLTITDDGCGFDPAAERRRDAHHGWGLMIMRERAASVGAELSVESTAGCGTQVIVNLRGSCP